MKSAKNAQIRVKNEMSPPNAIECLWSGLFATMSRANFFVFATSPISQTKTFAYFSCRIQWMESLMWIFGKLGDHSKFDSPLLANFIDREIFVKRKPSSKFTSQFILTKMDWTNALWPLNSLYRPCPKSQARFSVIWNVCAERMCSWWNAVKNTVQRKQPTTPVAIRWIGGSQECRKPLKTHTHTHTRAHEQAPFHRSHGPHIHENEVTSIRLAFAPLTFVSFDAAFAVSSKDNHHHSSNALEQLLGLCSIVSQSTN